MSDLSAPPENIDIDEDKIEEEALTSTSSQSSLCNAKVNSTYMPILHSIFD